MISIFSSLIATLIYNTKAGWRNWTKYILHTLIKIHTLPNDIKEVHLPLAAVSNNI